jgi:Cu2+-containing amine oxidase
MRAHVARNRKLVISSICTVANYEVCPILPIAWALILTR